MAFNLPAIQYPQNALLDFNPVTNALARYQKASEDAYDFGVAKKAGEFAQKGDLNNAALEAFKGGLPDLGAKFQGLDQSKKQFDLDYQHKIAQMTAGLAQAAQKEPDPNRRAAMTQRILSAHPSFTESIKTKLPPELQNDHDTVLKYIIASAAGYKDPLDEAQKRAQIANLNSQAPMNAAHAEFFKAQADQLRQKPQSVVEKLGDNKIVVVSPDRTKATEIYNAGPDISKLPEHVGKAANFAARMVDAEKYVRQVMADPKSFDPTSTKTMAINALPETMANWGIRSPQHQQYQQAAEMWIRAFLRKESGAAIAKDEFVRDFKVYFPQPGDSPEVIRQKEMARIRVTQGMAAEARDVFGTLAPEQAAQLKAYSTMAPRDPGQQIPPDAVRFLKANPQLAKEFDAKYGPNASKQFLTP